jgi:hypothetical protein
MAALFSIVSGVSLSVYSLKISIFFLRGTFSLTGENVPLYTSLLVSPLELAIGIGMMIASAVLLFMYKKLMHKIRERKPATNPTADVEMGANDFDRI